MVRLASHNPSFPKRQDVNTEGEEEREKSGGRKKLQVEERRSKSERGTVGDRKGRKPGGGGVQEERKENEGNERRAEEFTLKTYNGKISRLVTRHFNGLFIEKQTTERGNAS